MNIAEHNRKGWTIEVARGNPWTIPSSPEVIAAARRGEWSVLLTELRPTPRDWFPASLQGVDVLCLASGGGQQGPVLAAAGANVTVYDLTPAQLQRDLEVAEREGLTIRTVEGDMRDLAALADQSFDLIFHPVSNVFIPDVQPVWNEAFRVLRLGGSLLSGMMNPWEYLFDRALADTQGIYQVRFELPYSDIDSISDEERATAFGADSPVEFSHTLESLIGGQIAAGFLIAGFYESRRENDPFARFASSYFATRAIKPTEQVIDGK